MRHPLRHKRKTIALLIAALIVLFFLFDLQQYLALDYIKGQYERFNLYYQEHKLLVALIYMSLYIFITSLFLPGALILMLVGGALFGFMFGTVLAAIASTIGATFAFWVSRYLLYHYVQHAFHSKLRKVNEGIKKDGGFYLLILRIMPLLPNNVVNLLTGLTPLKTIIYIPISFIGMLPWTMFYVYTGQELVHITSIDDIVSTKVIAISAGLVLLLLAGKKFAAS